MYVYGLASNNYCGDVALCRPMVDVDTDTHTTLACVCIYIYMYIYNYNNMYICCGLVECVELVNNLCVCSPKHNNINPLFRG